jgi:quinoprotein glucose dehydrogenase
MRACWFLLFAAAAILVMPAGAFAQSSAAHDCSKTPEGYDWPTIGGPPGGGQCSALSQITKDNVKNLRLAWTYHADPDDKSEAVSFESVPLHVNNTLYLCSTHTATVAVDPETGHERWRFDPKTASAMQTCRGVAYWEAQSPAGGVCEKRIFRSVSTVDGPRIYALDANTGTPCPDFAAGTAHPGYLAMKEVAADATFDTTYISSPGAIYKDLLIVGEAILSSRIPNIPPGVVYAFDVRTGDLKWSFGNIPKEEVPNTRKGSVWSMISVDNDRGMIYLPTTSPSPNYYGGKRTVDMPYSDSVVALKADTGAVVWTFQDVHHDIWDYDLPAEPMLVTITHDGQQKDVVIQTTKTGYTFVLDRDTGKPVFPVPEKPVPASDVPGEVASPTQPMPDLPQPYVRQTMTRDEVFGLTPIDRAACRKKFDEARYEGIFTPPSLKGTILLPSMYGGGNWGGAAYDPTTNHLVVKAMNLAYYIKLVDRKNEAPEQRKPSLLDQQMKGEPYRMEGDLFVSPLGLPCSPPPWGTLSSIDMSTGRIDWQIPLGQVTRFGLTAPAFLKWGSPNIGGPLLTKAGLIFVAAGMDKKLRALDPATGAEVWQGALPHPGMSVPMTYMAGGKQYVVIAAGGNINAQTERGDTLVAFTLREGTK